jgi:predicted Fe-Mo cluster-binding NifX family protein
MNINYRAAFIALAFSCLPMLAQAEPDTLIAVAASANNSNAKISPVVAKASHFLLFDHDGNFIRAIKAKMPVTPNLVKQGVTVVVAEEFNRNQLDNLTAQGIIPIHKSGKAGAVVKAFLQCEKDSEAAKMQ